MKIKTPVEGWSGYVRGIYFARGEAECTDEIAIEWFKTHGYILVKEEPVKTTAPTAKERCQELLTEPTVPVTPLSELSTFSADDLRLFLLKSGVKIGNTRSKARLLQKIKDLWG